MGNEHLAEMRKSLDDIDAVIISALGERARLSREIATPKAGADGPVRDVDRETALLQHRSAYGARVGLDPAFVRRIYREILGDSVRRRHDALQAPRSTAGDTGRSPGARGRLRPSGPLPAFRRQQQTGLAQGLPDVPADARSRAGRPCRPRSTADREHHSRVGLRSV
ncbi:MAG: chorismate mutase [Acidobacteria bacterium]|nr:chorismate mutase [Acidobacteriota bacterium]